MSSIVTGEAVVLELRPASFAARALGLLLDMALSIALLVVILMGISAAGDDLDEAAQRALVLAGVVFCLVIVPVAIETLSRGLSLGKLAAGLRVVREDGGAIRFRHALIRGLTGFLEIYLTFGGLAIAVALFNERSRRLGDLMAGTYAIRSRVPVERSAPVFVPPRLTAWAATADIGRLPDATARRASQFTRQAGRMAPFSRAGMAESIATELAAHVAPPPPAGTSAEDYLAAVVAERRTRELARLGKARRRSAETGARLQRLPFSS
ncbi:putative RDD family membrane protein YckC [Pseudarthrobacter sp. W1I19]|uniref:RDD family protein n=1 Tax=Pseudarthrobacter sp. W1I19 TaxID=3042288 RepID=UPI00277D347E|nr:RDD family protein [Pseudarthrobacter sp. W1I19]MDQ0924346.1 putative RDD family membrane protein YckC [Pseudarthrobacter sp. W1I19]